jgi:hypothetical protein
VVENQRKNEANPLIFAVPAAVDVVGSTLNFLGLSLISASTY